jgi:YggT family protein
MLVLERIYWLVTNAVLAVLVAVLVLVLLRIIANQADLNPFGWAARMIRRLTDPLIMPVRRALVGFGVDAKFAPLVTILITILLGWFAWQLAANIVNTIAGVVQSLNARAIVPIVGYVLYGLLGFYSLLIFMRIVFSWVMVSYANRIMRFLVYATDPLLIPLRRLVPPIGTFDFSPLVAFLIVWLFQGAVKGTLLHGLPTVFFA